MKTLPLAQKHLEHGASFEERDGKNIPVSYGENILDEYKAAQESVVLYDRSSRAILRFFGPDREEWLQGKTTNDLNDLSLGEGQHSLVCSMKGKVLGNGILSKLENSFLFDFDPLSREPVKEILERFLIIEDVTIEDQSDSSAFLSLIGPNAIALARSFFTHESKDTDESDLTWLDSILSHREVSVFEQKVFVRRSSFGQQSSIDLILPESISTQVFESLLQQENAPRLLGANAAEILRIEGGVALYGKDVFDTTIPQEALLDEAISYTKGCYLGQETIARLHYRGHVNRLLCGIVLEGEILAEPGAKVLIGEEEKGKITSSCFSPKFSSPLALGYIRQKFSEEGTQVFVQNQEKKIKGKIKKLPLFL